MTQSGARECFGGTLEWGCFRICAIDDGEHILRISIQPSPHAQADSEIKAQSHALNTMPNLPKSQSPLTREILAQLTAYLSGTLRRFDLPILPSLQALAHKCPKAGSKRILESQSFQAKVLQHTLTIPYGSHASYHDIAHALDTRAYRAIGSALGRNPLLLLIPCHRVVRKDGSLGGYVAGAEAKAALLRLEGAEKPKNTEA